MRVINRQVVDPEIIGLLLSLIQSLSEGNKALPAPFESATHEFLDDFSPKAIKFILDMKKPEKEARDQFKKVLRAYIHLIPVMMGDAHDAFLEGAAEIFDVSKPLYQNESEVSWTLTVTYVGHQEMLNCAAETDLWKEAKRFFKDEFPTTCKFRKFYCVLKLLEGTRSVCDKDLFNEIVTTACQTLVVKSNEPEGQAIRAVEDKYVDKIFDLMRPILGNNKEICRALEKARLTMHLKLVKSQVLNKKYTGIASIRALMSKEYTDQKSLCEVLKKEKFVTAVIEDIHENLLEDFVVVFRRMLELNMCDKPEIALFWKVSVEQHPGSIEKFFAAWDKLTRGLPSQFIEWIFEAASDYYFAPHAALVFLNSKQSQVSDETKEDFMESLLVFCMSGNLEREERLFVIKTICNFIPKLVPKQQRVQENAMRMLNDESNWELPLHLIASTCAVLGSTERRKCYSLVIPLIEKHVEDVLPILESILTQTKDLTPDEFDQLLGITMAKLPELSHAVSEFYVHLIKKKDILDSTMLKMLIHAIDASKDTSPDIINVAILAFTAMEPKDEKYNVIESMCSMLFASANHELIHALVVFYHGLEDWGIQEFLERVASKLQNRGALEALECLIHEFEDGVNKEDLGIPSNKFLYPENSMVVKLEGAVAATLRVPLDMSIPRLSGWVSDIIKTPKEFISLACEGNRLCDGCIVTVNVGKSTKPYRPVKIEELPSQLLEHKIADIWMLLDGDLADHALRILNEMRSDKEQLAMLTKDPPNWQEFFMECSHYLLLYRLHMVGSFFTREPDHIESFVAIGGLSFLFDVLVKHADTFRQDEILLIESVILLILDQYAVKQEKNVRLSSKEINGVLDIILNMSSHAQIITKSLAILQTIGVESESDVDQEKFGNVVKTCMFHSVQEIRISMTDLIESGKLATSTELVLNLIPQAMKGDNDELFRVIKRVAETIENPDQLWKLISEQAMIAMAPDENLPKEQQLLFQHPPAITEAHIIELLMIVFQRMQNPPENVSILGQFLIHRVLFNFAVFRILPTTFFEFLSILTETDKDLVESLSTEITDAYKDYISLKTDTPSVPISDKITHRGLRNLGATCYMNSILQQLFFIQPLRNAILATKAPETEGKEWFAELQYIFAKLLLFPGNYVDTSSFVSMWRTWDGSQVNPREQQDAVEFFQLLLDRLEEIMPDVVKSLFQGEMELRILGKDCPFEHNQIETFVNLPIDIRGYGSLDQSLQAFLVPEHFHEYEAQDFGKISADRWNRVKKAPRVIVLTLTRFSFNMSTGVREKIDSFFSFPDEIDLSKITTEQSGRQCYNLIGIVQHAGTAEAGHYISYIYNDHSWWVFNDTSASSTDTGALAATYGGDECMGNAYLLFYADKDCELLRSTSEFVLDTSVAERLFQELRGLSLHQLHQNSEYKRLFFKYGKDSCQCIDYFLKDPTNIGFAEVLLARAKDAGFAREVIEDDTIHEAVTELAKQEYSKIVGECMSSVPSDFLETFIGEQLSKILSISEGLQTCTEFPSFLFVPLREYLHVVVDCDVTKWYDVIESAVTSVMKNPRLTSLDISSLISVLTALGQKDPAIAKKIHKSLPEDRLAELLSSKAGAALSEMMFSFSSQGICDGTIVESLMQAENPSPDVMTSYFAQILGKKDEKEALRFLSHLSHQTKILKETLQTISVRSFTFTDEMREQFFTLLRTWIDLFICNEDDLVRTASEEVLYSMLSKGSEPATADSETVAFILNLFQTLIQFMPTLASKTRKVIRSSEVNSIAKKLPMRQYFRLLEWSATKSIVSEDIVDLWPALPQVLEPLTDIIRDQRIRTPILYVLEAIMKILETTTTNQFFLSPVCEYVNRALAYGQSSDFNGVIGRFLNLIPDRNAYVFVDTALYHFLLKTAYSDEALARLVSDTIIRLEYSDRVCEHLFRDYFRVNFKYSGVCEYLRLCWKAMKRNKNSVNVFESQKLPDMLVNAFVDHYKKPAAQANQQVLCWLKTLAVYNTSFCAVNANSYALLSLCTYIEWLANWWQSHLPSLDRVFQAGMYHFSCKFAGSGAWDLLASLANMSAPWARNVYALYESRKPLLAHVPPHGRKGCVRFIDALFILRVKAGAITHIRAFALLSEEFSEIISRCGNFVTGLIRSVFVVMTKYAKMGGIPERAELAEFLARASNIEIYCQDTVNLIENLLFSTETVRKWAINATSLISASLRQLLREYNKDTAIDVTNAVRFLKSISSRYGVTVLLRGMEFDDLQQLAEMMNKHGHTEIVNFIENVTSNMFD